MYQSEAKEEIKKGWFGYISSGETSLLDLNQAFKALEEVKESLQQSLEHFTIPEIVVVGSTSAGKSAVLRRFSQLPFFPSAEGMCTRIPIRVEIRKPPPGVPPSAKMSLYRFDQTAKRYSKEPEPGHSCELNLEEAIKTVNEKMQKLLENTQLQVGQSMIMDRELRIQIVSEKFPMLNLVDLPGLVPSGAGKQWKKDAEDTRELFKRYSGGRHSLFLCILPATDTPDRWEGMHLIEEEGLQESSLGILTKCDHPGTKPEFLQKWLANELGYGFVAVAAGAASEERKVQDVDQEEHSTFLRLFGADELLKDVTCIKSVRKKITDAYLKQVYERWVPSALAQLLSDWISSAKEWEKAERDRQEELKERMQSCDKAFADLEQMHKTPLNDILQPGTCGSIHAAPQGPPGPPGRCKRLISDWWQAGWHSCSAA